MTKRVAIAIWILGLFVFAVLDAPSVHAADYYMVRSDDMLYRVPHNALGAFFDNRVVPHPQRHTQNKKRFTLIPPPQIVKASWYGPRFHGRPMANGQTFDMYKIFIAHKELPLGTCVQVKNPRNGRVVQAPVSDRGPYIPGRKFDLSCYAMSILGGIERGVIPVKYQIVPELRWCDPSATADKSILVEARRRCWEESEENK